MKKVLLFLTLVWVFGSSLFAQPQIGTGTGTSQRLPIYSCFGYNYSQQIYTAAELNAAIGTNNLITKIRFFVATTAFTQSSYNQWVVYMGNTAQASFTSNTNWVPLTSMSQVYSGTLPAMSNGQWVELTLAAPFAWDGVSNLVVAVDENASGYSCTQAFGSYTAGSNRGILFYSDSTNPNPASPPSASSRYNDIPRLQLQAISPQPCTTNPPTPITVNNITASEAVVNWTTSMGATYVLRYRTTPSGAWQTVNLNTPYTSTYTITGLTELTNYEVQIATVCGGVTGAFSPSQFFTTPSITYCNTGPTSTTVYEYMSNVTVTPTGFATMVSNSTTPPPFYTDYASDVARRITLIRGTSNNTIAVTKTYPGTPWSAGTRAWIDFNRNGTFETTEMVLNSPSNTTTNVNATFSVPSVAQGAYAGNLPLKMRVSLREGGLPDPCGPFTWGEVEDYQVNLIDLQPCTTAAPTPIAVSNITHNSASLNWMPTANATYVVRWRTSPNGPWLPSATGVVLPAGQSFYNITGLLEQTNYQVQISTICNGTQGPFGASVPFLTKPLVYCTMIGTGTNDHISNVTVTPINFPVMSNTTVQNNYSDYRLDPTKLIELEIGSNGNVISVGKDWTAGTPFSDAVTVWLDFNRDGTFSSTERIMTSAASTLTPTLATFSVPATGVYTGPFTTTMRVALQRNAAPVICVNPINGEVEDYAVSLKPCSNTTPTNISFNTITENSAIVNWTVGLNNNAFTVRYRPVTTPAAAWTNISANVLGGNPPLSLTGLTPATTYEVQVAAVCSDTPGAYSPVATFTTRCDPTPPNIVVSNVTSNSATVTWNPLVANATYVLRWREIGTATWNTPAVPAPPTNSFTITNLQSYKKYEVQVASICNGETMNNPWSLAQVFTTVRICEVPTPGLTITAIFPTTANVTWDPFPGATYILRYRKIGIPSWTNVPVVNNFYTITGLLEVTQYEMQVANVCNGVIAEFCPLYFFTTPTVTYCDMTSSDSSSESISRVTVTPNGKPRMISESDATNYSNYTADPSRVIELIQGSNQNEITVEKKMAGGSSAGVAVWIDFNRNGYFDLDERILADGPNSNLTATTRFSVPNDAYVSSSASKFLVMRVAMQKDGLPVNCVSFPNGEVEDYMVRISKKAFVSGLNQNEILIYPNPVSTVLNVKNISPIAKYKLYNAAGQLVSSGHILNGSINVSKLISGVYIIDITDAKGTAQKKFIKE